MTRPSQFGKQPGKRGRYGTGQQIQQFPQAATIDYPDHRGGYDSSTGRELGRGSTSPQTIDFQVNTHGRIERIPGTTTPEFLVGHSVYEMLVQESLSNAGELLLLDPPYVGIRGAGAITWADRGLPVSPEPFRYALYGETLVIGNGSGSVYTREPEGDLIASETIPMAKSFAVFSARLFAGGTEIDGEYQPMGIRWNTTSGDVQDFSGAGSGFELLIADSTKGDEIVAVRMMNLDLMGIVCKNSIWVGRRTNDEFRPAAFEPRVSGVGGLSDRTTLATPLGLTYLSESGLRTFDGNSSIHLSEAIDGELLPLDLDSINYYRLVYDYRRNRVLLFTPVCLWIYDIEHTRWYRSSLVATDAVLFKDQLPGLTWAEAETAGMTWDTTSATWIQLSRREIGQASMYYVKPLTDSPLVKESPLAQFQFNQPMYPRWEYHYQDGPRFDQIFTVDAALIEYKGYATIRIYTPDNKGNLVPRITQTLDNNPVLAVARIPFIASGRGVSSMVELVVGDIEISKFQLVGDPRSGQTSTPMEAPTAYNPPWSGS